MGFFYNDGTTAGGPTLDGGGRSKTQRTPRIWHEGRLYSSKAKTLAGRHLRSHQLGQETPRDVGQRLSLPSERLLHAQASAENTQIDDTT